jgi:hypothetical protein
VEDILAVVFIFGGGMLIALSMSPVGRAIAERIRRADQGGGDAVKRLQETQSAVLEEVDLMRQELADIQERLDFTERLLARHRDDMALPQGDDAQTP